MLSLADINIFVLFTFPHFTCSKRRVQTTAITVIHSSVAGTLPWERLAFVNGVWSYPWHSLKGIHGFPQGLALERNENEKVITVAHSTH